jgi:hypothetical protein
MFPCVDNLLKVAPPHEKVKDVYLFKTELDKERFNTLVDNEWEREMFKDKGFVKTYSQIQKEVFEKYFEEM